MDMTEAGKSIQNEEDKVRSLKKRAKEQHKKEI
jgi:hypothetical protein